MNNIKRTVKSAATLCFFALALFTTTSCNDWLDLTPNNEQVVKDYWQSKEEVEAVLASGYAQMRTSVPTLIKWGELRGGMFYTSTTSEAKLQDFNMTASNSLCSYANMYKTIGYANSVLHYAAGVQANDNTYYDQLLNAHLSEAYFQRAYNYLLLVKNYKEVPLITEAYVDDSQEMSVAKSSEADILEQIKADCRTALALRGVKSVYETDWQTKGRATKWALYALMADACLWNGDYKECVDYCDSIIDASKGKDTFYPIFLSNTSNWYDIYYPGNSNESIFELNWSYDLAQETNNFASMLAYTSGPTSGSEMQFTTQAITMLITENTNAVLNGADEAGRVGRMNMATYYVDGNYTLLWKYRGTDVVDATGGVRNNSDANFILYRVAEVMLMKAQAEVMLGNFEEAVELVNKIRARANLTQLSADNYNTKQSLMQAVMYEKQMEFVGEGKRWYDLLWLGRIADFNSYAIEQISLYNQTTKADWIKSTLTDLNAWYMPLPQTDIDSNNKLVQNPYYN